MARVVFLVADVGQVAGGDLHDIGPVLSQGAGAGGPGQYPCQVQHSNPGQGTAAFGQCFRWSVSNFDDLHQWQGGYRGCLRVLGPLFHGAHHTSGALGGDDGFFKF